MEKERIDKWLWCVRIFKSRTQAIDACKNGRVKINNSLAKPSATVKSGDVISVSKMGFDFSFRVLKIISQRVGAPIAVQCYENVTPSDELNKYKRWFVSQSRFEFREKGAGRPTKKERREIDSFKGNSEMISFWLDYDEEEED